jgi:hypothetical protein
MLCAGFANILLLFPLFFYMKICLQNLMVVVDIWSITDGVGLGWMVKLSYLVPTLHEIQLFLSLNGSSTPRQRTIGPSERSSYVTQSAMLCWKWTTVSRKKSQLWVASILYIHLFSASAIVIYFGDYSIETTIFLLRKKGGNREE